MLRYLMKSMSRKWKDRVEESQWRTLVNYCNTDNAKIVEENGVEPTRMDGFKKIHDRKDGSTFSQSAKRATDDMDALNQKMSHQIILSRRIVQSTLQNCPSDLIALSFFLWCAKQPNYFHHPDAFDHMVDLLTRLTQQLKTVKTITDKLKSVGVVIKPQTLLLLLRIYWRGGMFDLVIEVYNEILAYGYIPNTYTRNILMDVLFKIGRISDAINVLNYANTPNFLTFSIAIRNLCKLNDFINIQNVLYRMFRYGYYPDAEHYKMILSCCCKLGKIAEALQVLGVMITRCGGPTASCHVWSILIDGFFKSGRPVTANRLFLKMVELGFTPSVVTYTSLIKGLLETERPEIAFKILNNCGYEPDLVLCNVLIDGLSKLGRYSDALKVFKSLPKIKLVPDSYTFSSLISTICLSQRFSLLPFLIGGYVIESDLVLCNSILNYFCKAGDYSSAIKFYDDMIERHIIPDRYSYVSLLSGLLGERRVSDAFNVYKGIVRNYQSDAHVHTVMLNGLIKYGAFCTAVSLFNRALNEKYPLDDVAFIIMLRGFCKEKNVEMIEKLLRVIDRGIVLDFSTLNMVKKVLESHGSHMFVRRLFDGINSPDVSVNSPDVSVSGSEDFSDVEASLG